jgi:hypothetical protein
MNYATFCGGHHRLSQHRQRAALRGGFRHQPTNHKLETRLGVTLFERHSRGMVLTDAGQILANHVRKNMRDMEFAMAEIQGLKAVRKALVRIACTEGWRLTCCRGTGAFSSATPCGEF